MCTICIYTYIHTSVCGTAFTYVSIPKKKDYIHAPGLQVVYMYVRACPCEVNHHYQKCVCTNVYVQPGKRHTHACIHTYIHTYTRCRTANGCLRSTASARPTCRHTRTPTLTPTIRPSHSNQNRYACIHACVYWCVCMSSAAACLLNTQHAYLPSEHGRAIKTGMYVCMCGVQCVCVYMQIQALTMHANRDCINDSFNVHGQVTTIHTYTRTYTHTHAGFDHQCERGLQHQFFHREWASGYQCQLWFQRQRCRFVLASMCVCMYACGLCVCMYVCMYVSSP